jgi:tetratricopeptide (TPR) repeat protein
MGFLRGAEVMGREKQNRGLRQAPAVAFLLSALMAMALPLQAEGASRRQRMHWAAQAQGLYEKKDYAEAVSLLEKAMAPGAAERDMLQWRPLLGRYHEASGNYQKALTAYQQAYQAQPKSLDRKLDLARVYAQVDLNDQAVDLYKQVLKKDKHRKDVVLALAQLYFKSHRLELAEAQINQYVRWEPRDLFAQDLLARVEEATGRWEQAAHRRENLMAQSPSAQGYFDLGRLWARQTQYDLADAAFAKAEKLGYKSAEFYFQRGLLAWQRGKKDAAAALWSRALEKDPRFLTAKFFLALADKESGKRAAGLERMRQVKAETSSDFVRALAEDFFTSSSTSGERR